jgi:type II secretory pathway component GspD/PulD (secretin)
MGVRKRLGLSLALALMLGFNSVALASNVSLTINDGDIRSVLSALSSLSGRSIVTDDSVKGTISIDLNDVPFETALDLITRSKGLAYKTVSNVIVVSSADNIDKFFGNMSTYKLQYANAKEVAESLKGIIKSGVSYDPVTNSILFSGSTGDEAKLRDALKVLDVATKQVTLEARIIALNVEDVKNLGINWAWGEIPKQDSSSSGSSSSSSSSDTSNYGGIIHWGHGYTSKFQATLNALYSNGKANILATPRIITIPGKQASIFIGDHIPVVTEKTTNGTTSTTTEYVDAGIKLAYTPIVSDDDYITAVVHTEVSTPTLVSELKNYRITSRTADTNVRMRNGETLVIGGLIDEEEQKNIQRVPFLSNIPILGELFKNRTTTKSKTEVMMILTPYVTNAGESPAIYDSRVQNATLSPVPGTSDYEDAQALKKEEAAKQAAKKAAENATIGNAKETSPYEVKKAPLTMRQKAEQILAQEKAASK